MPNVLELPFWLAISIFAMATSISSLREKHASHVHFIWYVFSLTFCITVLTLIYVKAGPQNNLHSRIQEVAKIVFENIIDIKEDAVFIFSTVFIVIVPQALSFLISGCFGCGSPPRFIEAASSFILWSFVKFFAIMGGICFAFSLGSFVQRDLKVGAFLLVFTTTLTAVPFFLMAIYNSIFSSFFSKKWRDRYPTLYERLTKYNRTSDIKEKS